MRLVGRGVDGVVRVVLLRLEGGVVVELVEERRRHLVLAEGRDRRRPDVDSTPVGEERVHHNHGSTKGDLRLHWRLGSEEPSAHRCGQLPVNVRAAIQVALDVLQIQPSHPIHELRARPQRWGQ